MLSSIAPVSTSTEYAVAPLVSNPFSTITHEDPKNAGVMLYHPSASTFQRADIVSSPLVSSVSSVSKHANSP